MHSGPTDAPRQPGLPLIKMIIPTTVPVLGRPSSVAPVAQCSQAACVTARTPGPGTELRRPRMPETDPEPGPEILQVGQTQAGTGTELIGQWPRQPGPAAVPVPGTGAETQS